MIDEGEPVEPDFVASVRAILVANRLRNKAEGRKSGDPGYLISNHSELAEAALRGDQTLLSKIIGPAKEGTKAPKQIKRSRDLGRIRDALGMNKPERVTIEVPAHRAAVLNLMALLPEEAFAIFEAEIRRRSR